MPDNRDDGFLSRWARRKALARQGAVVEEVPLAPPPLPPLAASVTTALSIEPEPSAPGQATALARAPTDESAPAPAAPPPPPTLADAQGLTPASDFRRFVASDVSPDVRNTALKQLWADPAYNVMDGLDIYIDDYGKPDPLPLSVLRRMAQAKFMNLFDEEPAAEGSAAALAADPAQTPSADHSPVPAAADTNAATASPTDTATETTAPDEDPDLRLQRHDAPGPESAEPGAEPDAGRER